MCGWFWRRELCAPSLIQRRAPRPRLQGPPGTQLPNACGRGEGRRRQHCPLRGSSEGGSRARGCVGCSGQVPGGCGPGVLSVSVRVDEESYLGRKLHTHRTSQIQALRSPSSFRASVAFHEPGGKFWAIPLCLLVTRREGRSHPVS